MILRIDTTNGILVEVKDKRKIAASVIHAEKNKQSELLIPAINKALKKARIALGDIKGIEVADQGGSFTSLRIGIATANALSYGLNVPVRPLGGSNRKFRNKLAVPKYSSEPNITKKKKI
jgi:tRNA threonylcarbamoyladenosine biosynthesis protein TsaB